MNRPRSQLLALTEVSGVFVLALIAFRLVSASALSSCARLLEQPWSVALGLSTFRSKSDGTTAFKESRKLNISIATVGSRGDVQPYVALGLGLQRSGHRIQIVTDRIFEGFIRDAGLGFAPIQADPQKALQMEDVRKIGSNPIRLLRSIERNFKPIARQYFAELKAACLGADALLFATLALAAPHVAKALQIPALATYLQPVTPTKSFANSSFPHIPGWFPLRGSLNWLSFRLTNRSFFWLIKDTINECRRNVLALPSLPWRYYSSMDVTRVPIIYGYSPHVLPKPPDWGDWLHVTGYWFHDSQQGWQPPADLVRFLKEGSAPVYVGFGSMIDWESEALTRLVIEAFQRSKHRGVLLGGWSGLGAPEFSKTIFKINTVPHEWLFPRMSVVVVHHGGAGTTAASLRAGIPSVTVPFFADQSFWGWQMHKLRVGTKPIPRQRLTAENLAQAIRAASANEMISCAVALGKQICEENGVEKAVRLIERHIQKR